MFDAKTLLDQLMGAGRSGGAGQAGTPGLGGLAGQMMDMARQHLGGAGGGSPTAKGGDVMGRARDMMGRNPMATGAVIGALGTILLGGGKPSRMIENAVKLGGVAILGGLAYKAYEAYRAGQTPGTAEATPALPPPSDTPFAPERTSDETTLAYIRAMIAAASADGLIDASERERILGGVRQAGLDTEAAQWLEQEMAAPASLETLARAATCEETAAQMYLAARLTIEPDHPAETRFLAALGGILGLQPALVAHLEATAQQALARA